MSKRSQRYTMAVAAGMFAVLAALIPGTAGAEPAPPGPTTTSTNDDLTDMVMDAIEHGAPASPTTTPLPAPPLSGQ